MKQFQYKAITADNQRLEGIVEAKDQASAVEMLRNKKLLVIELKDAQAGWKYTIGLLLSKINATDLIYFTRQLSTMLNAGLPILSSMQLIKRKAKPTLIKVLDQITAGIEGGDTLYKALAAHPDVFSAVYLALIKAGETAGVLGTILERLSENLEKDREFRSKVKAAMLYPAIIMIAMGGVAIIMVFMVIPKMADIYDDFDAKLPFYTQLMIDGSEFIRMYWFFILPVVFVCFYLIITWLKTANGKTYLDTHILRIPYLGELQHKVISANVTRTLALLIKSGVSIVESLNIVSNVSSNSVYQKGLTRAAEDVEKGLPLSASFAKEHFFPEVIVQMITVGEETGKVDDILVKISKQYEKDSLIALKALTSAIEPAMIVILGVGVGVMVISIIVPIYNLTSSI